MTTGGAGRAGTARDGAGRAAAAASVAAVLTGLLAGCAAPTAPSSPSSAPSLSSSPTPPEALCTRLVVHWAREVLGGGTYGDYQSMGLSDGQYEILRAVVDEARAERKRRGADAADELIRREARTGCAAWYRSGGPGTGAWR
ncbi:hypothetical protein [Streptomyces sp. Amel2xC10]|uniref:hypothetical protein n=1 Tax=Streptomyces sp. Amel2xC10 TaxID=1305826 RepID=UPI000A084AC8|nr:hypothetical protein [Streptomyces sp. Amel2xC10]SMF29412.1 hypothetical protein SAMN02745830_02686 [Streptomyces sp. Amel2xC10]